ncbi:protein Las1p [[Candida] jaroonii]|uniref:Protein Las1p n=1 Tax=[Candida] jaroonii TaxID=467808 RepID=A0ACA9Y3D1_9ASCO|nr:protein Las1p [[Candida] jaroonii]
MNDHINRFNRQPSIVSYKSIDDLIILKDWFYNFNESRDLRKKAIDRVKAIGSRGKLPHCIESTSFLTSICLTDPKFQTKSSTSPDIQHDSNVLQLSYSMALVRFVNGLLDSLQQSNFAIPLYQLAKGLKVPSFFVELRHMATHEKLPSLVMLRIAVKDALNWLYDNYWSKIDNLDSDEEVDEEDMLQKDIDSIESQVEIFQSVESTIINSLKIYKKIRKQDIDYVYKFGNSTESGLKYWKAVKAIRKVIDKYGHGVLINVLIHRDFIVRSRDYNEKYCGLLKKLYNPLIEELGLDFKLDLLDMMIKIFEPQTAVDEKIIKKLGFELNEDQIKSIIFWIGQIINDFHNNLKDKKQKLPSPFNSPTFLASLIERLKNLKHIQILERLETIDFSPEMNQDISTHLKTLQTANKLKKYEDVLSLEDVVEPEPPVKKQKTQTHYILEPHEDWQPTPFGTLI